ncbi:MAG: hypothetical protein NVSMB46_03530 [Candidatus Saccharimonadales bacterium]
MSEFGPEQSGGKGTPGAETKSVDWSKVGSLTWEWVHMTDEELDEVAAQVNAAYGVLTRPEKSDINEPKGNERSSEAKDV